jgi:phosphoglycolate phosphatase
VPHPKPPRRFDAAIVDLDGTMVDTVGDFEHALVAAFQEFGLPAPGRDFIARTVGKGGEHLIANCLAHVGGDKSLAPAVWQRYEAHYLSINGRFSSVYAGVTDGLAHLRSEGLKLACLTNKPAAFARPLLHSKGLAPFFDHVFGGDAFSHKKPHPLPVLKTCEALGVAPARVLMVGDSSNDAQAARAAGCTVVLVAYGYNHGEPLAEAGAHAIVERMDARSLAQLLHG